MPVFIDNTPYSVEPILNGQPSPRVTAKYRFDFNKLTESNEFTITLEMLMDLYNI